MRRFKKVAIIGSGLIGGSIGMALKKQRLATLVVGVCRHQSSINKSRKRGAIDQGTLDHIMAVKDTDLVILCVPVKQIVKISKKIAAHLKAGCILTDTGSTKEVIVREVESIIPEGVSFVGAHPMAGSEKRGVSEASAQLYKGTQCILTPTKHTNKAALAKVRALWKSLGSKVTLLSPQKHDRIMALVSHLPHLAAAQLVKTAATTLEFAASGFFDTTRIASSDEEIWSDIFLSNRKFLLEAVDKYRENIRAIRAIISKGNEKALKAQFRKIKLLRDGQCINK